MANGTSILRFLENLALFRELDGSALKRLAAGSAVVEAPRGATITRRGDPCAGFHVLVFGQVKMSVHTPRGDEKVIEVLERGESFGESAMFVGTAYRTTATALADSKLLYLSKEIVMAELEREPRLARMLIERLSRRVNRLLGSVEDFVLRSGTERVANYLLTQLPERRRSETPVITFGTRKGVIASQLNLTQEHFSRILHELVVAGLIEVNGPAIRVLDPTGLQNRVPG
jgi:CRP/FNR family transcriptional regulator, dissimilatory nitrate respiration regulator